MQFILIEGNLINTRDVYSIRKEDNNVYSIFKKEDNKLFLIHVSGVHVSATYTYQTEEERDFAFNLIQDDIKYGKNLIIVPKDVKDTEIIL